MAKDSRPDWKSIKPHLKRTKKNKVLKMKDKMMKLMKMSKKMANNRRNKNSKKLSNPKVRPQIKNKHRKMATISHVRIIINKNQSIKDRKKIRRIVKVKRKELDFQVLNLTFSLILFKLYQSIKSLINLFFIV